MKKLYDVLKFYGVEKYVSFDLGMVNRLNYYTGIIFRGYTHWSMVITGGICFLIFYILNVTLPLAFV